MPGTRARVVSATPLIAQPSPSFSKRTLASVLIESGSWPPAPSTPESCIEKQPACAAPISSSGLVPGPSSIRELNEYGPSKAPDPKAMRPLPSGSDPFHSAFAVRVGMRLFLLGVLYLRARHDSRAAPHVPRHRGCHRGRRTDPARGRGGRNGQARQLGADA